jgi:hypothetical protein
MSDPHLQEVAHWHPIDGTPEKKRVATGCSVGAVIETYDFIGFGTAAAALYFGHNGRRCLAVTLARQTLVMARPKWLGTKIVTARSRRR